MKVKVECATCLFPPRIFRKACLCSVVGNVMEFEIPNHAFKFEDLEKMIQRSEED